MSGLFDLTSVVSKGSVSSVEDEGFGSLRRAKPQIFTTASSVEGAVSPPRVPVEELERFSGRPAIAELYVRMYEASCKVSEASCRASEANCRASEASRRADEASSKVREKELMVREKELEASVKQKDLEVKERDCEIERLRAASATASVPGSAGSGPGAVAQRAHVMAWRRRVVSRAASNDSWRATSLSSTSGFSTEGGADDGGPQPATGGRCYAALATQGGRSALVKTCGKWPTVSRLLSLPMTALSRHKLHTYVLVHAGADKWHVADAESYPPATATVADVLGRLVRELDDSLEVGDARWEGTLLAHLSSLPVPLGTFSLPDLKSKVGGDFEGPVSRADVVVYPSQVPDVTIDVVYLGGSVERPNRQWRERLVSACGGAGCTFVSPCAFGDWRAESRDELDSNKALWERAAMDTAGCVVLRFVAGSSSAVSLVELGRFLGSKSLVVCCDPEHWAYSAVRALSVAYGFECVDTEQLLVVSVLRRVQQAPAEAAVFGSFEARTTLAWRRNRDGTILHCGGGVAVGPVVRYRVQFQASAPVDRLVLYEFEAPGAGGMVRMPKLPGVEVSGSVGRSGEDYLLRCGSKCLLQSTLSFGLFTPAFEFDVSASDDVSRTLLGPLAVVSPPLVSVGAARLSGKWCPAGWLSEPSYLRLFLPSRRADAFNRLGAECGIWWLFQFPAEWYCLDQLREARFSLLGDGKWAVTGLPSAPTIACCVSVWRGQGHGIQECFSNGSAGAVAGVAFELPSYAHSIVI